MTPTIVVSSEDVSPIIISEAPIENAIFAPSTGDSPPLEKVQPNEDKPPIEAVIASGASPVIMPTTPNSLEAARVGTPPLNIRKRAPTIILPSVVDQASKDPDTKTVPADPQVLVSPIPQAAVKLHNVSAWISDTHKKGTVDSIPILQPMLVEHDKKVPKPSAPDILPTLPPPDIVIQTLENIQEPDDAKNDHFNAGVRSREVGLTLNVEKLDDGSLMSPPLLSGMLNFLENCLH